MIAEPDRTLKSQWKDVTDMAILQKAMTTILGSPQLRDVLLYTTLLLIFATAWASDRWPDDAIWIIATAFVVLAGEASLLYFAVKRLGASSTTDGKPGV